MRLPGWILLLVGFGGCKGCGEASPAPETAVHNETAAPVGDAPKAELVYKRAYERARKELNADNAAARLRELEREVDRGLEELP